jgi:hypothetical protein
MILTLREWQLISKDVNNLIVQASTTDGCNQWHPFPIVHKFIIPYKPKLYGIIYVFSIIPIIRGDFSTL